MQLTTYVYDDVTVCSPVQLIPSRKLVCGKEDSIEVEYRAVSCVFQNIDPPPPSPPGECVLPTDI